MLTELATNRRSVAAKQKDLNATVEQLRHTVLESINNGQ